MCKVCMPIGNLRICSILFFLEAICKYTVFHLQALKQLIKPAGITLKKVIPAGYTSKGY